MKFVAISDVHIKKEGDKAEILFHQFLKHPLTLSADIIFLLGDIFDLMVGGHKEYLQDFPKTFELIRSVLETEKKIYYFEGNHDFHWESLFYYLRKEWNIDSESFVYYKKPLEIDIDDRRILFAHGDEIELDNKPYQQYRKIIRSKLVDFLTNKIFSYKIVSGVGEKASKKSREINTERYADKNTLLQKKFRKIFRDEKNKRGIDHLVCGHSHCLDLYEEAGFYSNNGFFPHTKTFTSYKDGKFSHVKLEID